MHYSFSHHTHKHDIDLLRDPPLLALIEFIPLIVCKPFYLTYPFVNNKAASSGSQGTMRLGSTLNAGVTTPYGRSPCRKLDTELAAIMNYSDDILNNDDVYDDIVKTNLKSTGLTKDDYKESARKRLFDSKSAHGPLDYDDVM